MRVPVALALAALAACLAATPAHAASRLTRYSLVNRCVTLAGGAKAVPGASRLRFRATDLSRYLLYTRGHRFLTANADGSVTPAASPSPAGVWIVSGRRGGPFVLRPSSTPGRALTRTGRLGSPTSKAARLGTRGARRCAVYPEAALDASGRPRRAPISYGRVGGILEGHMHWMTYQFLGGRFHCGKPWDPYGIAYALPDCSGIEGPRGTAAPFQNTLNYGNPTQPHDTSGYPRFASWSNSNLTYEGTYYRWVQRAYLGGLRMMVMGVNENRVLCELQANRQTNCDEMTTVRNGFRAMHALQRYVDAQAGGPGKGFFQIVTNPYQARRVIARGRMAVVLEIEVSELFGCRNVDAPTCDTASVDRQLNEMHRLGVRSMLLLNKFDNPLSGVRFDEGAQGVLINAGNKDSAGEFWRAKTCTGPLHDNTIYQPTPQQAGVLGALVQTIGLPGGAPVYPPAPHCNTRGLTALGRHVIDRMMALHMIVNPDHMSQAAVSSTLDELEKRHYSGVISPHGWMDPGNWPRLWRLGGLAFPGHSSAPSYVSEWKTYRPRRTPYLLGWGYGADMGGLSHQPTLDGEKGTLRYPFKSPDGGVTLRRQRTGQRTFDYTKEGVSQYGLYADWFADLRRIGGRRLGSDMWNGAEAYLEMWERADGIRAPGCARGTATVGRRGLRALRLGRSWVRLLRAAGQPQQRTRAWSWCVAGRGNAGRADVAELSRAGRVELVGSTALGRSVRGVRVGAATAHAGTRLVRRGRVVFVTVARGGRVRAVGVGTRALARHRGALRAAAARLLRARASQAARVFVPSRAQAGRASRLLGHTLAGTSNPQLNAALAEYCHLQLQAQGGR